jgi:hypothetical protein
MRYETQEGDSVELQKNNLSNTEFWKQAFVDMILLSQSSTFIFRTSNLANAAIIHSPGNQKLIRI